MIDMKEMERIEKLLRENDVYIMSSIGGKGHHIGRFKGFRLDANDSLIIETDIDGMSCTSEC